MPCKFQVERESPVFFFCLIYFRLCFRFASVAHAYDLRVVYALLLARF